MRCTNILRVAICAAVEQMPRVCGVERDHVASLFGNQQGAVLPAGEAGNHGLNIRAAERRI
jgi:hypothetical protein